jgi:hypothetical protein
MLDPTEAGWLAKYIEIRSTLPFSEKVNLIEGKEEKLYAHLHNSGILYGHPIKLPMELELEMNKWPVKERLKLIFAEAFIATGLIMNPDFIGVDSAQLEDRFGKSIIEFYENYRPELLKSGILSLKRNKTPLGQTEVIFDRRIKVKAQWNASFWRGFFHNIILFVDIIHYIDWINTNTEKKSELLQQQAFQIRWDVLKLVAMASNVNQEVRKNEQRLFDFFVESAEFNKEYRLKAKELIKQDAQLSELSINKNSSWLHRKYFLELAILTLWADRKISAKEEVFLLELCTHLGFDETDRDSSILSVQSFVMNNWDRIHFLQEKQNFFILRKHLTERMKKVAKKYTSEIKQEIHESGDLMSLLKLANTRELSVSEKEQVRMQLYDILKSIPAFVIFALPFSFLTIPVLMKIIPKSAFPSSFDPNRLNVKKRGNRTIDS